MFFYYVKGLPIILPPESKKRRRAQIFSNFVCMSDVKGLYDAALSKYKKRTAQILRNFVCMCYGKDLLIMLRPESIKWKRVKFSAVLCKCSMLKDSLSCYSLTVQNGGVLKFYAVLCICAM